jgi:hypothetical protein
MTNKFYAIGTSDKGSSHVIDNLDGFYPVALRQAKEECAKQGLNFQFMRPLNKDTAASTLTKFYKLRRAKGLK